MKKKKPISGNEVEKLIITIPNYKLPSWNKFYSGTTHWDRQSLAKEAHELTMVYAPSNFSSAFGAGIIKDLVDIEVIAYYKHKFRRDSDNVCDKLVIDGLKGKVIEDDDTRFVRKTTSQAVIGHNSDMVVIEIRKVRKLKRVKN